MDLLTDEERDEVKEADAEYAKAEAAGPRGKQLQSSVIDVDL